MAENEDVNMDNNEKISDDVVDPTHILLKNLHELMVKNQDEQKKFNEEMREKFRSVEENIKKLSEDQQKETLSISEKSGGTDGKHEIESVDIETPRASSDTIVTPTSILPTTGKSFVLKHVFNKVSSMKKYEDYCSKEEEHFGVPWEFSLSRKGDWLQFFLYGYTPLNNEKWFIESKLVLKMRSNSGNYMTKELNEPMKSVENDGWGDRKFIEWEKLNKDYVKDDKFTVEVHVQIKRMEGIYKDDLKKFDQSMVKFSDVILIVKGRKFYVLKLFLAANSPYFESLFLGQFQESKKSEITLTGIDDDDFQNYLEVLYGEYSIDEMTVEGILLVADMYDTPIVIRKCEEFFIKTSEKTLKKKLKMAARYSLEQLKNKCMSEVKTIADIKSVLPENIDDLDPSIMAELFKKSLELQ